MLPRADWVGWPLLLGLAAFGWYASYCTYGDLIQDEGWQLDSALRILGGQIQHRDFHSIYPAGRHYVIAALLAATDESLLAVRLHWCLLDACGVALVLAIGRRLMPTGLAVVATLLTVALPGPWHKVYYALIPLLGCYLVLRWREDDRRRWLALAGLATGIGAWIRQDVAVFTLFAAGSLLALIGIAERRSGARRALTGFASSAAWLLVPALAAFGIGLVFFAAHDAAGLAIDQLFVESVTEGQPWNSIFLDALKLQIPDLSPIASRAVAALCWLPLLLGVPLLGGRLIASVRGRPIDPAGAATWCVAISCLLAANQLFRIEVLIRFLQVGPLVYLLLFATSWRLARAAGVRRWLARASVGVALALALGLALLVYLEPGSRAVLPVEYTGTAAVRWERDAPFEVRGTTFRFSRKRANDLQRLIRFFEEQTAPGDPILVLGQPSSLYYLTGRASPLDAVRLDDWSTDRAGRERIEQRLLDSGLRFLVAEEPFFVGEGPRWRDFLERRAKLVGPVGKQFRVWEIQR